MDSDTFFFIRRTRAHPPGRARHEARRATYETALEQFEEQVDSAVLDFMLCGASWPWSIEEIIREFGDEADARDAVARLTGTGLVHQLDRFVFPTRTARRAEELQIGTV